MKAAILAGGFGTRISNESRLRPKPMIEIGGQPLLWHIMKIYAAYGIHEFVICAGFMGQVVREYFAGNPHVNVIDTGQHTMTGGRLLRIREYVGDEPFFLTYGDGVADIDINALLKLHREKGTLATVTAVNIEQRFGVIRTDGNGLVMQFREKNEQDCCMINAGFMVMEPGVFDYIKGDATVLERDTMERLAADGQLTAYQHRGFWQCMDTLQEKLLLEELWRSGNAPWKIW